MINLKEYLLGLVTTLLIISVLFLIAYFSNAGTVLLMLAIGQVLVISYGVALCYKK